MPLSKVLATGKYMNIRKTFFWLHLIIGCSAAIFIFLMSITGVALTYERQMIKLAERSDYPSIPENVSQALPLSEILIIAQNYQTKKTPQIVLENHPNAPVIIKDGRKKVAYLNPYTGKEMAVPGLGTKNFLRKLRAFHRWLTLDGKFSENGRWVNGISNVIFITLILSGLYLWLPKKLKSRALKQRLTLTGNYKNKSARNYQWHNVFGFYMAPVLFILAFTAIFFSFKWPGQTLKQFVSTQSTELTKPVEAGIEQKSSLLPIDKQLNTVKEHYPQWQNIQFSLDNMPMNSKIYNIDNGNGGEPQKRVSVLIDSLNGELIEEMKFEHKSTYSKLRSYIRFGHTGEVFGLVGQTIAGIASLLACLLVYTGAMLSWRRWKNSRKAKAAQPELVN
jgi:uncharacterized iron-regulated membrane protein